MILENVCVGDEGTIVEKTIMHDGVAVDVSSATTMQIVFTGPGGATSTLPAAFTTDGTDGKIYVVSVAGTWSAPGRWSEQAQVTLAAPAGSWCQAPPDIRRAYPKQ